MALPGAELLMTNKQVSLIENAGAGSREATQRAQTRVQMAPPPATKLFTGAGVTTHHASVSTTLCPETGGMLPTPARFADPVAKPMQTCADWGVGVSAMTLPGENSRGAGGAQETRQTTQLPGSTSAVGSPVQATVGTATGVAVPTTGVMPRTVSPVLTTALPMSLMTPLPRIPPFSGEGQEAGFVEWHEHFENVANLAEWDDHWRLVHLTAGLKDTAASFYRSCSCEVRNNYQSLLTALKRRFTPVQFTAVHTQLFHNQLQGPGESVEQFVQDLHKLFNWAYAQATREGPQAERMGQILLANQFVAGLCPELKWKLISVDGSLEELVLKARFEEAKGREFAGQVGGAQPVGELSPKHRGVAKRPAPATTPGGQLQTDRKPEEQSTQGARTIRGKCFNCGIEGHLSRACPYLKKKRQEEAARGRREGTMSALTTNKREVQKEIQDLRRQLLAAEALMAVQESTDVLHSVSGSEDGARS